MQPFSDESMQKQQHCRNTAHIFGENGYKITVEIGAKKRYVANLKCLILNHFGNKIING